MTLYALLTLPALGASACGGGSSSEQPATCEPSGTEIAVVAGPGFRFDTECLAVPAGTPITVELRNEDWEVHNLAVLQEGESNLGSSHRFFVAAGPDQTSTETWGPMEAGTYEFRCTIHPAMSGAFIVG
jgi:plastocyanin